MCANGVNVTKTESSQRDSRVYVCEKRHAWFSIHLFLKFRSREVSIIHSIDVYTSLVFRERESDWLSAIARGFFTIEKIERAMFKVCKRNSDTRNVLSWCWMIDQFDLLISNFWRYFPMVSQIEWEEICAGMWMDFFLFSSFNFVNNCRMISIDTWLGDSYSFYTTLLDFMITRWQIKNNRSTTTK